MTIDVRHAEEQRRRLPRVRAGTQTTGGLGKLAVPLADTRVPNDQDISVGTNANGAEVIVVAEDGPPAIGWHHWILLAGAEIDEVRPGRVGAIPRRRRLLYVSLVQRRLGDAQRFPPGQVSKDYAESCIAIGVLRQMTGAVGRSGEARDLLGAGLQPTPAADDAGMSVRAAHRIGLGVRLVGTIPVAAPLPSVPL